MSGNTTDLSSEFDITAVETNAFDKQELIVWASKLELESIDYRTASIDLMQQLSSISNSLTIKLKEINQHMYELKSHAHEEDMKLKTFIDYTISEELDSVYEKMTYLTAKVNDLQKCIFEFDNKNDRIQDLKYEFDTYVKKQNKKYLNYESKIKEHEQIIESAARNQKSIAQLTINQESFDNFKNEQIQKSLIYDSKFKKLEQLIVTIQNERLSDLPNINKDEGSTRLINSREKDFSTTLNQKEHSIHDDFDEETSIDKKLIQQQPTIKKAPVIVRRDKRRTVTRATKRDSSTEARLSKPVSNGSKGHPKRRPNGRSNGKPTGKPTGRPRGRPRGRPKANSTRLLIFN